MLNSNEVATIDDNNPFRCVGFWESEFNRMFFSAERKNLLFDDIKNSYTNKQWYWTKWLCQEYKIFCLNTPGVFKIEHMPTPLHVHSCLKHSDGDFAGPCTFMFEAQ